MSKIKNQTIGRLRADGLHEIADWLEIWRNSEGGNGGWDGPFSSQHPELAKKYQVGHGALRAGSGKEKKTPVQPRRLSQKFPYAVHLVPLHALPSVVEQGAILSRTERRSRGIEIDRSSSATTDDLLGVSSFVHLYLLRTEHDWKHPGSTFIAQAPLIKTMPRAPAFPFVVFLFETSALEATDWLACPRNIAKGKPKIPGRSAPGFWITETPAERLEHWKTFAEAFRGNVRGQRGVLLDGLHIPVVPKSEDLTEWWFAFQGTTTVELLVRERVEVERAVALYAYSPEDLELVQTLGLVVPVELGSSEFYDRGAVDSTVLAETERAFRERAHLPDIDFDA